MSSYEINITNNVPDTNLKPIKVIIKMLCHFYIDGKSYKFNYTFPSTRIMEKVTLTTHLPSTTKVNGFEISFVDINKKFIYKFPKGSNSSMLDIEVNATRKIKIDIQYENVYPKVIINNNNDYQPTSIKKHKKFLMF
ncbi:putative orfan [Tupanvirus soda lake]|uniref:Orfan n=2 Tax=Tupanvirus TaxID=2094720 RepID=A0AC62AAE1_9VIRU|nr:putative orfan [Tupanvirus soda lake]QKU34757.1 putative orfan [Tupanvirus soda lake]